MRLLSGVITGIVGALIAVAGLLAILNFIDLPEQTLPLITMWVGILMLGDAVT